jgi:hypothetical protein
MFELKAQKSIFSALLYVFHFEAEKSPLELIRK